MIIIKFLLMAVILFLDFVADILDLLSEGVAHVIVFLCDLINEEEEGDKREGA